ncbi:hypothetical protein AK812_SmicGene41609 [Symbiodinium microadriaticum]|uniref:Uncharacterized protein n=1 Tax=Symbiodinium microadriaticum TaxID=2951 RepID=A0A1Q9C5N5_SYMMI|nr:hypothetical protein AK812_SmicGene41609 [Symbiodinium microadriaticum]
MIVERLRALSRRAAAQFPTRAPLATAGLIFGAANAAGFGISVATGWHYHLDLIGTGIFSAASLALVGQPGDLRQNASAACISVWAFGFWFISFAWGWLVFLPHSLAAGVPAVLRPPFGALDPESRGKFCNVGVWQLSHPNWCGNFVACSSEVTGASVNSACISPAFLLALFYGQATGSITNTVELAKSRHGADPAYQEYLQQTPLVLPTPGSLLRAVTSA